MTPTLSRTAIDDAVAAERLRIVDTVTPLTDAQWATPSLCSAWTVRDVIAHLTTTTRLRVPHLLRAAVRARGDFDRMEIDLAAERAGRFTTADLVAQLRDSAATTRRMPGSGPMDPLMDLVIHAQDIARPLDLTHLTPPDVVAACLAYVAPNRLMGGPKRLAGLRIVADSGLSLGSGPEVRGPDIDLLLAVAGRPAGLAALDGPGATTLTDRLAPS